MASTAANNVVRNLFLSILGRAADTSGLGNLTSQYDSLISSGYSASSATGTVAASMATSNEARSYVMPIYNLYQSVLSRGPDFTGLVYWEEQLHSHSMTLSQLAQQFISSTEFVSRYTGLSGDTLNRSAIASFYTNGLLRSYDPSGYQYWVDMANSGTPLARIASQFAYSNEALGIGMTSAASTRVVNYLVALGTSSNIAANGGVWNSVSEAINGATRAGIDTGGTVQSPGTVTVTPSNAFTLTEARDTPVGSAWTAFNGPLVLSSNKIAYVQTLNSSDVLNGTAATLTAQLTGGATIAPRTTGVSTLVVTDLSSHTNTFASTINVTYMTDLATIINTDSISRGVNFNGFVSPPNVISVVNQRVGTDTAISSRGLFGVNDIISLNLNGDTSSGIITIQSTVPNTSGWETINISSTGKSTNSIELASGNSNSLDMITISGSANLTIRSIDASAMASITSIDAGAFTGNLVLGSGVVGGLMSVSNSLTIKSGSGNDIVYLSSVLTRSSYNIDLGSQSTTYGDKLVLVGHLPVWDSPQLTGIETIEFAETVNNGIGVGLQGGTSSADCRYNLMNVTGVIRIQLDYYGQPNVIAAVDNFNQPSAGLIISAVGSGFNSSQSFNGITINAIDASGLMDTDTIDISNNGVRFGVFNTSPGIPSAAYNSVYMGKISLNKIENIIINVHDASGDMYGTVYRSASIGFAGLYSDTVKSLTATGDVSLDLYELNVPLLRTANFTGIRNGVYASFSSITSGANILLSQGPDSITGGSFNDTITGGPGADTIYGGLGHDVIVYAAQLAAESSVTYAAHSFTNTKADVLYLKAGDIIVITGQAPFSGGAAVPGTSAASSNIELRNAGVLTPYYLAKDELDAAPTSYARANTGAQDVIYYNDGVDTYLHVNGATAAATSADLVIRIVGIHTFSITEGSADITILS